MAQGSPYDSLKANAFAERLLRTLNDGALCLMISVGHRTGLLDAMRDVASATSAEIAAKAGLNERYVREWLGAMVTGHIVDVDPATNRFSLPAEHAAFLTRAAGADNIGVFTQYISLLGSVEDDIVECFKKGGGVPYAKFPRFHEVMAEDKRAVRVIVLGIAHRAARIGIGPKTHERNSDARCRLWAWPDHQPARGALSEEPFHRNGFVERGDFIGVGGRGGQKVAEYRIHRRRPQSFRRKRRSGVLRLGCDLRCDSRSGETFERAARNSPHASPRWYLSDAGHQRFELHS